MLRIANDISHRCHERVKLEDLFLLTISLQREHLAIVDEELLQGMPQANHALQCLCQAQPAMGSMLEDLDTYPKVLNLGR